jgi:hypothetical protein
MTNAKIQFERHIRGIDRSRYSAEGIQAEISSFANTDHARAVDKAVDQVRHRRDEAQDEVDTIRRGLTPDGDVAAELRASRFWERTRRVLDNTDSARLFGCAHKIISTANRQQLGTLLQELPAYLEAHGQAAEWLDAAAAEILPEFRHAREQLTKAGQAVQIAESNAQALRRGFTQGRPPTVLVDPGDKYDPDASPST